MVQAPDRPIAPSEPSPWEGPVARLNETLATSEAGLTSEEARCRLARVGPNAIRPHGRSGPWAILAAQFKSPIILILLFAAGLSIYTGDAHDAVLILAIVFLSGVLGFSQEYAAGNAVEKLVASVQVRASVLRDGSPQEVPLEAVVPGDVVVLSAGDAIPGDARVLTANHLFVNEAVLTGETFPVEKGPEPGTAEAPVSRRPNALLMGTHVVSGSAKALVVRTGADTELAHIADRLGAKEPETDFERGVTGFGYLLMEVTLLLVMAIFAINVYLQRPILEAFLFSLALAVGLTPQLLPAIISINLAHGARRMAREQVIVKRLSAIENFGAMDVLCSDKTGTLTEGTVQLSGARGASGTESEKVRLYAYLNAHFETSYADPIDEALRRLEPAGADAWRKLDEEPYDFVRKRLSVLVAAGERHVIVTKGALAKVLNVCDSAEQEDGRLVAMAEAREDLEALYQGYSERGMRVLGLAYRDAGDETLMSKCHEEGMVFLGFLLFSDPLKEGICETIAELKGMGVALKVITGDNRHIAQTVCGALGLDPQRLLTGPEMAEMSLEALVHAVDGTQIFAEVEPNQKERILVACRQAGHVVGYLGDGINDGPALHAADVGISVDSAADVAKEAAAFVMLKKDLGVLAAGVTAGRQTFANTLKYVFMATSANFGNMFSMAGASLFLSFLPLLPTQILLTNLMTDFPEMTIAIDRVDAEVLDRPQRWDIGFIRRFMITFGLLSSVFDYMTFGVLLWGLHATPAQFRTGWFVESVLSASLIVLVIRTRRPFFQSLPAWPLLLTTLGMAVVTMLLPITPLGADFQFVPLPLGFYGVLLGILAVYVTMAELAKRVFYGMMSS